MYCTGCGQMVTDELAACPKCGRLVKGPPTGPMSEAAQLYHFTQTIRRLRHYWFLFAGLNVALGVAGLVMVQMGWSQRVGPWEPWPHPPLLEWTFLGASAWTLLILRVALAAAASMGLRNHTDWARPVTVMAAIVAITQFPVGLLLGAYTLVKLLGKRSATLFARMS